VGRYAPHEGNTIPFDRVILKPIDQLSYFLRFAHSRMKSKAPNGEKRAPVVTKIAITFRDFLIVYQMHPVLFKVVVDVFFFCIGYIIHIHEYASIFFRSTSNVVQDLIPLVSIISHFIDKTLDVNSVYVVIIHPFDVPFNRLRSKGAEKACVAAIAVLQFGRTKFVAVKLCEIRPHVKLIMIGAWNTTTRPMFPPFITFVTSGSEPSLVSSHDRVGERGAIYNFPIIDTGGGYHW